MRKLFIIATLLLLPCKSLMAQYSIGFDSLLQEKFNYQVKQISQFFDRFNFTEPLKLSDDNILSRKKNLVSLINMQDNNLTRNPVTIEFLKYVGDQANHIYLNFDDSNWFSTAHCSFVYHNRSIIVDIILQVQGDKVNGFKWVITGVKNDIFSHSTVSGSVTPIFINPMNNEVGFSELSKAIREKDKIFFYASSSFKPNALSAFFFMLQNGDIIFKQINSIDYQFFQVPGWIFQVKDFNRSEYNSGWLIASIMKIDEKEKNNYKMSLINN